MKANLDEFRDVQTDWLAKVMASVVGGDDLPLQCGVWLWTQGGSQTIAATPAYCLWTLSVERAWP